MTSQSLEAIKSVKSQLNQISSEDGEDKKFVSQAVTFVIGHARNGFVALCASVASLLKEQARLKQEIESLQKENLLLRKISSKVDKFPAESIKKKTDLWIQNPRVHEPKSCSSNQNPGEKILESCSPLKCCNQLPYRNLKGCICSQCFQNKTQPSLTVPLHEGEKVIIRGEICGVVKYVGHVDSLEFPEIYAGIKLSEAVGNSDGSNGNKVYFSVPKNHGIFVPLSHIHCVMTNNNVKK